LNQTFLKLVPVDMYHFRAFRKNIKPFEYYKNYWNIDIAFSNIYFSESFSYGWHTVRIYTKGIYIHKLFVYMRTGVY